MHFGIVAAENLLDAKCLNKTSELTELRKKWENIGINLNKLKCFRFITNTTNGEINIFALGFKIKKML